MASTLDTLINRVQSQSRDTGGTFITPEDITDWLNEAYTDIAARQRLFDEEVSTTTSGNTLAFPTDEELIEILDIMLGTDDAAVFVDSPLWDSYVKVSAVPPNTIYRIFERQIELYPTPATGTAVVLRYRRLVTPLESPDDVHTLPTQLERKMLEYAKAQSRFKDGDFEAGNNWLALYEQGLRPVSSGIEQRSGPFQLIPEPWVGADPRW